MNLKPETLAEIEAVIPRYPQKMSAMLPLLHSIQRDQGYISPEAMEWVAQKLECTPIKVYEVVTFYPFFRTDPIGKRYVRLCRTLSCALCGGFKIAEVLEDELGCKMGETAPDGSATIEWAECLASCGTAPAMLVDDDLHENLTEAKVRELAQQWKKEAPGRAPEANGTSPEDETQSE